MTRRFILLFTIAFFFLAVGCSDGDVTTEEGLTIEEIISKSIEAMESLSSYSVEMETEQTMGITDEESFEMSTQLKMDILLDPITFYQQTTMDMGIMGGIITYDSYYSEEQGLFIEDPYVEGWAKFPDELFNDFLNLSNEQINPEDQLKLLLDYLSQLSVTSEEEQYIITLKGEGTDVSSLVDLIMGMSGENMNELMDLMSDIEIQSLEYTIYIDKETFYQVETDIFVEMRMEIIGDKISSTQRSHLIMSRFNELDDLTIPEDIINNAVELTEEDIFGGF